MKAVQFIKQPKHLYFSIVVMLTIVLGLVSISFSYYVDESSNQTKMVTLTSVENELRSNDLNEGKVTVLPNETKEIVLYIVSNNAFASQCKLFYMSSSDIEVYTSVPYQKVDAFEAKKVPIIIQNHGKTEEVVSIGIENGFLNQEIQVKDHEIIEK